MAEAWYYIENEQQIGPVNAAQLRQLAADGRLTPASVVWKEGMTDWTPASRLKGLFSAAHIASPPPPPMAPPPPPNTLSSAPTGQLEQMRSMIGRLQVLYAVLFGSSMIVLVLQVTALGFKPPSVVLYALLLCGAVGCRGYRTSLVNRHNGLASADGKPMI